MVEKLIHKFEVKKEFHLKRPNGYMGVAKVGEVLELPNDVVPDLLLTGHIIPCRMKEIDEYEVIRPDTFRTVDAVVFLKEGEIVRLTREEAIPLLVNQKVRPVDKLAFHPQFKNNLKEDFNNPIWRRR